MSQWTRYLTRAIDAVDTGTDRVRYRLNDRFGTDQLIAFPYLTYGRADRIWIMGRVLEVNNIQPARDDASLWENLTNAYRRFESDEVPHARVRVCFDQTDLELEADDEGYFEAWLPVRPSLPVGHAYVQTAKVELLAPIRGDVPAVQATASIVVPGSDAQFGVISDVDDTVLQTGATSLVSMAKKVLFGNARTRLPFEGVSGFYRALHDGRNPIFYVSSSPWNLYDVLVEFFDLNDIPAGPLLLRDWGVNAKELLPTSHGSHKRDAIQQILDTYPELLFLLIGDSGQEDPEIYADIVRRNPGRVQAIYIRDVSHDASRDNQVQKLAGLLAAEGHSLQLVADTVTAARHAAAQGFIAGDAVRNVAQAKAKDQRCDRL
ncbi:App1 family protein [soil metagenome]